MVTAAFSFGLKEKICLLNDQKLTAQHNCATLKMRGLL